MVSSILYKKANRKSDSLASHTIYDIQYTIYSPRALRARGMTLIEVTVGISVLIMVLLALTTTLQSFYSTNRYAIGQSSAVTSAQRGMDKVIRAIRESAYSSQGAFPIVSIAANDFIFYANVNSDPLIERVHYFVSGTSLIEGIISATGDPPAYTTAEATSTLSDYVHNLDQNVKTFRYYDGAGVEITDYSKWANVRFVEVSIVVDVDPNKPPNQLTLRSSAGIRNLK